MLSTETLTCPWCLAPISLVVDASPGDQSYIEDCEVCCQPMTVRVRVSGDALVAVDVERED